MPPLDFKTISPYESYFGVLEKKILREKKEIWMKDHSDLKWEDDSVLDIGDTIYRECTFDIPVKIKITKITNNGYNWILADKKDQKYDGWSARKAFKVSLISKTKRIFSKIDPYGEEDWSE